MGYFAQKNTKAGSWRILERTGKNNKSKTLSVETYTSLGIHQGMTLVEAKARCKQLNLQDTIETKKRVEAAEKIAHQNLINRAYLPTELTVKFEEHLEEITFGIKFSKTIYHQWATVQTIISKLELDPKDFYQNRHKFYKYFMIEKFSPSYASKLIRLINLWGHFLSRSSNSFYQPIPRPKNLDKQRLVEAREDKQGVRKESTPLTETILMNCQTTFSNHQLTESWNWLYIAFWFGLRPSEVDGLKDQKTFRIERDQINKIDVLYVYQSKLTGISKDKRWKPIPIFFDEQKKAIKLLKTESFKRPLVKILTKYISEGFDNYSPRKGFTDLMLGKGFSIEDISVFLGHRDISMTWKHYKNKMVFKLPG